MTDAEIEAESRKYSLDVIIMLPLRDGRWAVFNAARQLQYISINPLSRLHEVQPPALRLSRRPALTLEDLGL